MLRTYAEDSGLRSGKTGIADPALGRVAAPIGLLQQSLVTESSASLDRLPAIGREPDHSKSEKECCIRFGNHSALDDRRRLKQGVAVSEESTVVIDDDGAEATLCEDIFDPPVTRSVYLRRDLAARPTSPMPTNNPVPGSGTTLA